MVENNVAQEPRMFLLNGELAQQIAGYLATKPYNEVVTMLNQLTQLQSVVYRPGIQTPLQQQVPNTESQPGDQLPAQSEPAAE